MNPYYFGVILVIISATGFALMPIFTIYAYQDGTDTLSLLFIRFFLASLVFFVILLWRRISIRLNPAQLLRLILLGSVFYTVQATLYFSSLHFLPAATVTLLMYIYPALVALFSFWFNKEPLNKNLLLALVVSFIGLGLVLGSSFQTINKFGAALALISALIYAVYIMVSSRVIKEISPLVTSTFVTLFASFSILIAGITTQRINFDFTAQAWAAIIGIILFSTVTAIFGFFKGIELIGSTRASILSMIEPLVTIIFAYILFNDHLSAPQWLGAVLIISGAMLVTSARDKEIDGSQTVP